MAEPFLSEIRIMSFVYAPKGWALCKLYRHRQLKRLPGFARRAARR